MTTKTCIECHVEKPVSDFYPSGKYLNSRCKPCCNEISRRYGKENRARRNARLREWRRNNPDAAKAKDLRARYKRKYGLTPEQVDDLKASQNGQCLICGVVCDLFVDHDHATGAVRGALCPSCNTFLGRVEANPTILDRMNDYANGHLSSPWLAISNKTSA